MVARRRAKVAALAALTLLVTAIAGGQTVGAGEGAEPAPRPYPLGANRHLFLDEFLIAEKTNVTLAVNTPQCMELVIIPDKPWERGGITSYCNVFWDSYYREYRLYYVPVDLESDPMFRLALATSQDGICWEKPDLGAVEWKGSKENNIVIDGQREGTVLIDPNGTPEKRYVFLSSHPELKTRLFTSPDGIHWTMHPTQISDHHSDSQISSFWDDQLEKYVHYPRIGHRGRATGRVETSAMDEPWPEDIPLVLSADDQDPPGMDLYTNSAEKYRLAPNVYLAFPTPYYHYNHRGREYLNQPTLAIGGKTNDGTLETQLAVSRDGKNWMRYRTPYVPLYKHEGLDLKANMVFPGLLYHDTRIDHYFGGYAFTHGDTQARVRLEGRQLGGIFRLQQRIDGFVSADFAYTGGRLTTEPLVFEGNCLALNVNTSASGEARVAILDADGNPIGGFAAEDCLIINGDYLTKVVIWKGGADVSELAGRPVRLRFEMRGAKLYAFQFSQCDLSAEKLWGMPEDRRIEDPSNLAPQGRVSVSSEHAGGFEGKKAVDGVVPGYTRPVGEPQFEWASAAEREGAWLQLDWDRPVAADSVILYDRPNHVDQVLAATLTFDDESSVAVGALPNDGKKGLTVEFSERRIARLRCTIDRVSPGCSNAGLAEIVVRATGAQLTVLADRELYAFQFQPQQK